MFWAERLVEKIKNQYKEKIGSGEPLIIRDEKTISGRVHVGSLRGVAIHGIIAEILNEWKIRNRFLYEINDFDPLDALPVYLSDSRLSAEGDSFFLGKPLCDVPSPDGSAKNYAEYFAGEFIGTIKKLGFEAEYYRSSDLYKSGKYNEAIKLVLENAAQIRQIYKRVSGAIKKSDWLPLQVICERCGKVGVTKVISFDGKEVEYVCEENLVEWAKGCGYRGKISPFDGNAKLPWKVEWAAKFAILNVDIEGAGKDHTTRGGSREVSDAICKKVFKREPPFNIPYEFFHIAGKKMSTSKGEGSSSKDMADLLPPALLRFLLLKEPKKVIDFVPDGDTVPALYDEYDKMAERYFNEVGDDYARNFALAQPPKNREALEKRFLPRFSRITFLIQMPHMDINKEVSKMKRGALTESDKQEISLRASVAEYWLKTYAPEKYKYELQVSAPEATRRFSVKQKEALKLLLDYIKSRKELDGPTLHAKLHEIKKRVKIEPADFFRAIYISFLNRENGPQAGWFLSVLDKNFLEKRLEEILQN